MISYDVRVQQVEKRRNRQGTITSHRVCWTVDRRLRRRTFATAAQADAFRAELVVAARHGDAFAIRTGLPLA